MKVPQFPMPRDMSRYSALEAAMLHAVHVAGLPEPVAEYPFDKCCPHPKARHRREAAWTDYSSPGCEACFADCTQRGHLCFVTQATGCWRHYYRKGRNWRFDFAWPSLRLAVECEGGVFSGGRHTRGAGFTADAEKYNAAALAGWTVLRFTGAQVADGTAIETLERALAGRGTEVQGG